ncbi:hypothetical protein JCM3775_002623, partial [Rhodotorula graminis]
LYVGTERVLLVLLHSFPDFLSQAAPALVDTLPHEAVHLKNLINSAFPIQTSNVLLPDPLDATSADPDPQGLQVPLSIVDPAASLGAAGLRTVVDSWLDKATPVDLPSKLYERLVAAGPEAPVINGLVAHLMRHGTSGGGTSYNHDAPSARLLRDLVQRDDPALRYALLSGVANALRWPNLHSHWATTALLDLFASGERESVLRVVLERATTCRPVPHAVTAALTQLLHLHGPAVEETLAAALPANDPGANLLKEHLARLASGPRSTAPQ